jgi:hypothetical protein
MRHTFFLLRHAVALLAEALCLKPEGRGIVLMRFIFFNIPNASSRTMALGLTQPLIEMSTRNLPGGQKGLARSVDILTTICELTV